MEEALAVAEQEKPIEEGDGLEEGYAPVSWTRKKIALAVVIGVVVAALSLGCAAALYMHTIDLALAGGHGRRPKGRPRRGAAAVEAQERRAE